jgi:hypothetical protein
LTSFLTVPLGFFSGLTSSKGNLPVPSGYSRGTGGSTSPFQPWP